MNKSKLLYIAGGVACLLFAAVLLHTADTVFDGFSKKDDVVEESIGANEKIASYAVKTRKTNYGQNNYHSEKYKTKTKGSAAVTVIDLNRASAEELDTLPGVGAKIAALIVQYRQTHGRFERKEDLLEIKGIGVKKYEKLKDYVTVGE